MTNVKVERLDVLTDKEVIEELEQANRIKDVYRRLRARATISLLETGKRAEELASLRKDSLTIEPPFLYVRFVIEKKRKKSVTQLTRTKKFSLEGTHAKNIIEYLKFLELKLPYGVWLFPRGHNLFGGAYRFNFDKHITRHLIWRIVKALNKNDWAHQHRERLAVRIIKEEEAKNKNVSIETVYKVRAALDLEREDTAYRYIRRHETQLVREIDETIL